MNEKDILKALECCSKSGCSDNETKDCPLKPYKDCSTRLAINALDLINRQKAEIEGLQFDISELSKRIITLTDEKIRISSQRDEYLHRLALGVAWDNKPIVITSSELTNNVLSIACNNAIKEFAERLKSNYTIFNISSMVSLDMIFCDINRLLKEMTGGEDNAG